MNYSRAETLTRLVSGPVLPRAAAELDIVGLPHHIQLRQQLLRTATLSVTHCVRDDLNSVPMVSRC